MSEPDAGRNERRKAERITTRGKVGSQLTLDLDTSVLQISPGGMLVELPMALAVGSEHTFTLFIEGREVTLKGRVRNCRPLDPAGAEQQRVFRVGVEFCELSDGEARLLGNWVSKKLQT